METIREYLKENDNYLEIYLTENYHIYIDNGNSVDDVVCIELCDKNGNSVNIGCYVDITMNSLVNDVKESVINYLIGNYLFNHC